MPDPETQAQGGNATAKAKKNKKKKKQPESTSPPNGEDITNHHEEPEISEKEPSTATENETTGNGSIDKSTSDATDMTHKFNTLEKERDNLRQEVEKLRKSLEDIQEQHKQQIEGLQTKAETAEQEREEAEQKYSDLRDRVTDIRATLGERLKSNATEIAEANARIEELEEANKALEAGNSDLAASAVKLKSQNEQNAREVDTLRSRSNLSQQNWIKERDELIRLEALAREEYDNARQAMQDWEVLAMEERSMRENLRDKVSELESQLGSIQENHEKVAAERDSQSQTVDGLQRALRDIQEERKRELRELVESHKTQIEELERQQQTAEETALSAKAELEGTRKDLEKAIPFEKEVKEKNLQIGKLRHEAVILNDHLIKALRFIKRQNPDDQVDRQVVTNHFLRFLTLDRTDARKFQVLQIIAALLNWSDDQKEQAGLARPGAPALSTSSMRVHLTPFRNNSSSQVLGAEASMQDARGKDSLADLWSDFLEREAAEGLSTGTTIGSRRPSNSSGVGGMSTPTTEGPLSPPPH